MDSSTPFQIIGVLHLPALPGAPRNVLDAQAVVEHALRDAEALIEGGVSHCIIENLGDAPYRTGDVDPHVPAMLAVIGQRVRGEFGMTVGLNVLRNDAHSAMGAAVACGASFIRVNVLVGSAWTDQGLIHSKAASLLRYRRALSGSDDGPKIYADVHVKHAVPAAGFDIETTAVEAVERSGADGVIVTGARTGSPTSLGDLAAVRRVVTHHPIFVGSGVDEGSIGEISRLCNGAIVGTALHRDADISLPIDKNRVRAMVDATR